MFCREQVGSLSKWLDRFHAVGAELVVIGNGTPEEARTFRERGGHTMPIYVDPRLRAYRAAGLRRGITAVVSLKVLANARRAQAEGYSQGRTAGDPWQLGGVFAILPDGRVVFEQRSDAAGDHADPAAVLASLTAATGGASGTGPPDTSAP